MKSLRDYQELVENGRVIYINGPIDTESLDKWRIDRQEVLKNCPNSAIAVALNTPGGNPNEGWVIYHEIKALAVCPGNGRAVWMVCQGGVQSMGTYIMMAVPRQHRVAFPGTYFYCHRPVRGDSFEDSVALSERFDISDRRSKEQLGYARMEDEAFDKFEPIRERQLRRLIVDNTFMNSAELAQLINNPRIVGTREAQKLGFISRVLK
jgi:ATP-dependent protease ClpP protease subunit